MKVLGRYLFPFALVVGGSSLVFGANQTLKGSISDSACGVTHAKMVAEHKDLKTDRDCTLACVKAGGKYVVVADGKVYNITNQSLSELMQYAGQMVNVTGNVNGDTITVSKITAAK